MLTVITLLCLLNTGLTFTITKSECDTCVSKLCDQYSQACDKNRDCQDALKSFKECFKFYYKRTPHPFEECRGIANSVYSSLMDCYENCDYALLLGNIVQPWLTIAFLVIIILW